MANALYQVVKYNFILSKPDNHMRLNYVENITRHIFTHPLISSRNCQENRPAEKIFEIKKKCDDDQLALYVCLAFDSQQPKRPPHSGNIPSIGILVKRKVDGISKVV